MTAKLFQRLYLLFVFLILSGGSLEILFLMWYSSSIIALAKIYSHISFMLLILELISLISIGLTLMFLLKNLMELTFFFFLLCLLVGEACLGLSLMIMSSRFQKKELVSLSLL